MLACHASQRDWLLSHHRMDEYILSMKDSGISGDRKSKPGMAKGSGNIWDMVTRKRTS